MEIDLEDIKKWKKFKKNYDGVRLNNTDFEFLCKLHSVYFNHSYYKPCSCNGGKTIKGWAKDIDQLFLKNEN
tara:strand:- start:212 stop:427 length:216 start_codon:yes stop_codon:yes gene_type:complete